jgi:hypothetical protein
MLAEKFGVDDMTSAALSAASLRDDAVAKRATITRRYFSTLTEVASRGLDVRCPGYRARKLDI